MVEDRIKIIANTNAVDATIYTKGDAILNYSRANGVALEQIAGIGDELIDISFLTTPGLGFVGTVANAQQQVKDAVRGLSNGFVSKRECLDGFIEFYELARANGISNVVSDRDGVLVKEGDFSRGEEFKRLLDKMKEDYPHIAVLTGSSYEQNVPFMKAYGLDETLKDNPKAKQDPYMLLPENGVIQVNVLTGETRNLCLLLNPELHRRLKQEFEPVVIDRLKGVIQALGLAYSHDYSDQKGKVYLPNKQSMVTLNIPKEFPDGTRNYRKSNEAERLRQGIVDVMKETAQSQKLPYEIVRG